mmetsp:Transcript_22673/g.43042  ORF Transcript_22673/g.43042 Transcript_22673/m.43042 type:complete len:351 (-) Transcript_22673:131-1183(-)|eukprot:scaffold20398_cov184-Amphora_coffeaeformis.AAC.7
MKSPSKTPAASASASSKKAKQKLKKPRGYKLTEEEAMRIKEIKRYAAQKLGPDLKSLNTTVEGKSKQIGIAQYEWSKKTLPFELVYGKDPPPKRAIVPLGAEADSMLFGQIVRAIMREGYNPTEQDFVAKLAAYLEPKFYVWDIEERITAILHNSMHYTSMALDKLMKDWGTKSIKKREKDHETCHQIIHHLKTTFGKKSAVKNTTSNTNAPPANQNNHNLPSFVQGAQPAMLTQQALFGRIQGLEQQTFQLIGHLHHLEAMQAGALGRIQVLEQKNARLIERVQTLEGGKPEPPEQNATDKDNEAQAATEDENAAGKAVDDEQDTTQEKNPADSASGAKEGTQEKSADD